MALQHLCSLHLVQHHGSSQGKQVDLIILNSNQYRLFLCRSIKKIMYLYPVPETFGDYISKFSQLGDYISKFGQIWKIAKWIIQIGKFIYDKIN